MFCCHLLAVTLHNNHKMYPACISAIVYLTLFASIRLQYILCYNNQNIFPIDLYFSSAVGSHCAFHLHCAHYTTGPTSGRSEYQFQTVHAANGTSNTMSNSWHFLRNPAMAHIWPPKRTGSWGSIGDKYTPQHFENLVLRKYPYLLGSILDPKYW